MACVEVVINAFCVISFSLVCTSHHLFLSDRIKQFGAVNRQYGDRWRDVSYKPGVDLEAAGKDLNLRPKEDKPSVDTDQRAGTGKPHMDDSSTSLNLHTGKKTVAAAQDVSLLDYFSEVYHRDFSNTLGDLAIPR